MGALQIKNDGHLVIMTGRNRKETKWRRWEGEWSQLVNRLADAKRTPESLAEYAAMKKTDRDAIKDVGGFVGGELAGGRRKRDAVTGRTLLTLDLDHCTPNDDPWSQISMIDGYAAVLYSTHSHTARAPRYRLVIPLAREVTPEEYVPIARKVAAELGIEMFDDTTYETNRLMHFPSVSRDAEYVFEVSDGPWLDPDEYLAKYHDWHDVTEWPLSSREADIAVRLGAKQQDPTEKTGVVGAFCQIYDIETAIEEFLPDVYIKGQDGRYTYAGGSTANGLVVYDGGLFAYSHHATDPAGGKLCNAFDLVRLHRFASLDANTLPETPANRMPSYKAMVEEAMKDTAVANRLQEMRYEKLIDAFDEEPEEPDAEPVSKDWMKQLTLTDKGVIAQTVQNAQLIIENDPKLAGNYYRDEFRERMVVCGDLPWQALADRPIDQWTDTDDAGLHGYLEAKYGISNVNKINEALDLAMSDNRRHPVREYLDSLTWDEIPRADTLFIDYLGAEDIPYTRAVTRKALIGAVKRIYEPGCKHDHMLVLVGPQGCRKSTTLMKLGRQWFSDSLYTVAGKEAYEQLQGHWIIEMGEMAATRKAELEQIKQFISKQTDSYRAAYARRTQERPRQCAFFGTTNDDEFLRDSTGGRRFWPVVVTDIGRQMADHLTPQVIDLIWAEAVRYYRSGEDCWLDDEMEAEARRIQSAHTEQDVRRGLIEEFIDRKLPDDWDTRTLEKRMEFWRGWDGEPLEGDVVRQTICAMEVHCECFFGQPKDLTKAAARDINAILRQLPGWKAVPTVHDPIYGRQRGFRRAT